MTANKPRRSSGATNGAAKTPPPARRRSSSALYKKLKGRQVPDISEAPTARLLRAPAAVSQATAQRLGHQGGPIWDAAGELSRKIGGRFTQKQLWSRGIAAILVIHADADDAAILSLARGLMVALARDPRGECAEGRAIESATDELLRAARKEGC